MTSRKRRGCVWRIYTYPCVPQHLTPHAPKQALDPLHTSRIQPPSVAWIRARCHGELTPALRAPQATTKRDFGAAGSLMRQNDRVVALLLPLVVSYRSYLPRLARFASIGENRWLPGERPRVRIRPYACQHVTVLYIKHGLSIATCLLGGGGGCGSKKTGLMNMLEAQNTLVSILNPTVLNWDGGSSHFSKSPSRSDAGATISVGIWWAPSPPM